MVNQLGRIDGELLGRWRRVSLQWTALEKNPQVYSQQETERIVAEMWNVQSDVKDHLDKNGAGSYQYDGWTVDFDGTVYIPGYD